MHISGRERETEAVAGVPRRTSGGINRGAGAKVHFGSDGRSVTAGGYNESSMGCGPIKQWPVD